MNKAKEISTLWSQIKPQIGELVRLCHEVESHAEVTADAYQRGYETGYKDGYNEPGKNQQKAYQRGLNDAWEAAKKIFLPVHQGGLPASALIQIFGNSPIEYSLEDYSASECIEKIRQYEQEKEEQKEEKPIPVEDVMRQYLDMFCKGRSCTGCVLHDFTCGNGTQFLSEKHPVPDEEVRRAYAEVLQKMKEK